MWLASGEEARAAVAALQGRLYRGARLVVEESRQQGLADCYYYQVTRGQGTTLSETCTFLRVITN